jgi:hypothetical protein
LSCIARLESPADSDLAASLARACHGVGGSHGQGFDDTNPTSPAGLASKGTMYGEIYLASLSRGVAYLLTYVNLFSEQIGTVACCGTLMELP